MTEYPFQEALKSDGGFGHVLPIALQNYLDLSSLFWCSNCKTKTHLKYYNHVIS